MLHSPRVEGTRDGRVMYIGNADGALLAHDLRHAAVSPVLLRELFILHAFVHPA